MVAATEDALLDPSAIDIHQNGTLRFSLEVVAAKHVVDRTIGDCNMNIPSHMSILIIKSMPATINVANHGTFVKFNAGGNCTSCCNFVFFCLAVISVVDQAHGRAAIDITIESFVFCINSHRCGALHVGVLTQAAAIDIKMIVFRADSSCNHNGGITFNGTIHITTSKNATIDSCGSRAKNGAAVNGAAADIHHGISVDQCRDGRSLRGILSHAAAEEHTHRAIFHGDGVGSSRRWVFSACGFGAHISQSAAAVDVLANFSICFLNSH